MAESVQTSSAGGGRAADREAAAVRRGVRRSCSARVHRVPVNIVNYITAIFDDDKMTWTDLFKLAATNKKIRDFIIKYPLVIEDIRGLMGQPRSSSIHASALLVTPDRKDDEDLECFDFTPIKKVDGMLVSEVDGYSLDEQGLLKK